MWVALITKLLITVGLIASASLAYFKWKFGYWKRRNLPFLEPEFLWGNIPNPFNLKQKPGLFLTSLYKEMKKRGWKHGGIYIFTSPAYLVVDLEYAKNILTRDFDYFNKRGVYYNEKHDPLSAHLLYLGGTKWKTVRSKLNPNFTSSKLKMLFPIMLSCAENLLQNVEKVCEANLALDICKIASCFTMDIIGSCAFGLDCRFIKDENVGFQRSILEGGKMSKLQLLKLYMAAIFPGIARTLKVKHYSKDLSDFFMKFVMNEIEKRKHDEYNRQDFMQFILDLKSNNEGTFSVEEIAAHCYIFFVAGFDTSSSILTYFLYELAIHQEIQDRVRDEIRIVLGKRNKIDYETIMDLKYMDQVIYETMRKHPAGLYLTRKCCKDYHIPKNNVFIEKGTIALIPIYGFHYDEEYFPEPEKFDPERFNKDRRTSIQSYAYLPFGEGPRNCIGKRLGLLQVKMGLFVLLKTFCFTLNWKTEEPIKMALDSIVVKPEGKIWLDVVKV